MGQGSVPLGKTNKDVPNLADLFSRCLSLNLVLNQTVEWSSSLRCVLGLASSDCKWCTGKLICHIIEGTGTDGTRARESMMHVDQPQRNQAAKECRTDGLELEVDEL